jgi:hypothetical protein
MPALRPLHALLLLAPLLAAAQNKPEASSESFPLDAHGEAHFNIPVVVKLAAPDPSGKVAVVQRRDEESDDAFDGESPNTPSTPDLSSAEIPIAQEAHVNPLFEVVHQGANDAEHLDATDVAAHFGLHARDTAPPMATQTIILVETAGVVTSTVTEPCPNSTSAQQQNATSQTASKLPPIPGNATFPLTNGTNASTPHINGTAASGAGMVKPTGTGVVFNPANAGKPATSGKPMTGAAVGGRSAFNALRLVAGLAFVHAFVC